MRRSKIQFKNKEGNQLTAYLDMPPNGKADHFAIFAHCFTCTKNLKAVRHIVLALTQHGFGVLSFDFTGLGESEGDFSDTNFSSNVDDLIAAHEYLEEEYSKAELLIGHSLGGAAVLAAGLDLEVAAIATIGAPADPDHVLHLVKRKEDIREKGQAEVNIGGRPFLIKQQFLDDLENASIRPRLNDYNGALLVMHAPGDNTVGIENARLIFDSATHPKSFVSLNKADHLLSNQEDAIYAGKMIAEWSFNYLPKATNTNPETDKQAVARNYSNFITEVFTGKHQFIADEPEKEGGQDLGPSPYDLLASALATCTAMTLRMYIDRKKWNVDEILVHVEHNKEHSDDSNPDSEAGMIDILERKIEVFGNLDDDQKRKLLEIANKCPVHRTLLSEMTIRSKIF